MVLALSCCPSSAHPFFPLLVFVLGVDFKTFPVSAGAMFLGLDRDIPLHLFSPQFEAQLFDPFLARAESIYF